MFLGSYNVEILNSFNPELKFKNETPTKVFSYEFCEYF